MNNQPLSPARVNCDGATRARCPCLRVGGRGPRHPPRGSARPARHLRLLHPRLVLDAPRAAAPRPQPRGQLHRGEGGRRRRRRGRPRGAVLLLVRPRVSRGVPLPVRARVRPPRPLPGQGRPAPPKPAAALAQPQVLLRSALMPPGPLGERAQRERLGGAVVAKSGALRLLPLLLGRAAQPRRRDSGSRRQHDHRVPLHFLAISYHARRSAAHWPCHVRQEPGSARRGPAQAQEGAVTASTPVAVTRLRNVMAIVESQRKVTLQAKR